MDEKISDNEHLEQGQLLCRVILEVMGKPKEHVEATLKQYVDDIKGNKSFHVVEVDYAKTVPQDELFSTFVEITLWFKNASALLGFCFDYMPSSIEIHKPTRVEFESASFASLLNDLQAQLHNLDMLVKTLKQQNIVLNKNAKALLRNLLFHSLRRKPKNLQDLAKDIGIKEKHMEKFLNAFINDGKVKEEDGVYRYIGPESFAGD